MSHRSGSNFSLDFCGYCGKPAHEHGQAQGAIATLVCDSCKRTTYAQPPQKGPSLLVLAFLFAEDKFLLLKRGLAPYVGSWAPPGGFVEWGESLETAAIREVKEEIGITLRSEQLVPGGVLSLPALNQVCVGFLVVLDELVQPVANPPEALDARWFSEHELPTDQMWEPGVGIDHSRIWSSVRTGRLDIYQQTDDSLRVITSGPDITYIWRRTRP